MQKRRQFVYQELIATERDYIRDLECVVNVSVLYTSFQRVNPEIPVIRELNLKYQSSET